MILLDVNIGISAFAGSLLLFGVTRRKSRSMARISLAVLATVLLSFGMMGCVATPAPVPPVDTTYYTPAGTYTLTLSGVDIGNSTLKTSRTFAPTVQ